MTVNYKINWNYKSNYVAIILISIGIIIFIYSMFFNPISNAAVCSGSFINTNSLNFIIFGSSVISFMIGLAILYAGRERI